MVVLGPASGEPTYLRFVEQAMPEGYSPVGTFGWGVTEITVENSDKLYERLKDSAFKVTHPPSYVPTYSYLKAMQAEGPAGERLNLTWITERRPDLAVAKSFVGRCFIVVQERPRPAGVADRFYKEVFGNDASPIRNLPTIQLSVVKLDDGSKIEIDQYPASAKPAMRPPGGLPAGVALVMPSTAPASIATPGALPGPADPGRPGTALPRATAGPRPWSAQPANSSNSMDA